MKENEIKNSIELTAIEIRKLKKRKLEMIEELKKIKQENKIKRIKLAKKLRKSGLTLREISAVVGVSYELIRIYESDLDDYISKNKLIEEEIMK